MAQGGLNVTQERPELRTLLEQHELDPPGRLLQPEPPHLPQEAAQQALPERIPVEQVGSPVTQAPL